MTFFEMLKNIYKDQKANRNIGNYCRMKDGEQRILGSVICHSPQPHLTEFEVFGVKADTKYDVGHIDCTKYFSHDAITFRDIMATDWEKMSDDDVQEILDERLEEEERQEQELDVLDFEESLANKYTPIL